MTEFFKVCLGTIVGEEEIMTSSKCADFYDSALAGIAYVGVSGDPNVSLNPCQHSFTIDSLVYNTEEPTAGLSSGGVAIFKVLEEQYDEVTNIDHGSLNIIQAYLKKGMPQCIAAACIPTEQIPHGSRCWIPKGKC